MSDVRPDDDVPDEEPAGPCRSCRAPIWASQRYCLECGALVGERRLEPLDVLRERRGPEPPAPAPLPGRVVPMAAAAAAILVAGVSGALVTGGGDGARAAVIARAPAPAPVASPPADPAPSPDEPASPTSTPGDAAADGEDTEVAEPVASATEDVVPDPATDTGSDPGTDAGTDETAEDDAATPDDPTIDPHVWLLALDGPRAQEAIDRVAEQGVRLTGVATASTDTIGNASALVTGTLPIADPAAAAAAAASPTPSLPEVLTTAGQSWRSYLDVQPNGTDALPGACTDPAPDDAAAAVLAGRTPFGRIPALRADDACGAGTASLETLGNDVSSGETLPRFSYATLGGCAPPERTVVALPDQVSDTLTAITASTEYQENGVVIVTTVGAADPCPTAPAASRQAAASRHAATADAPASPVVAARDLPPSRGGSGAPRVAASRRSTGTPEPLPPAPTVVLRANAKPGSTLDVATDLRALTRLAATTLGVEPPGSSGADEVPALELPTTDG